MESDEDTDFSLDFDEPEEYDGYDSEALEEELLSTNSSSDASGRQDGSTGLEIALKPAPLEGEVRRKLFVKMEKHLCCKICCERYNDPAMLKCYHTFCRHCLEGLMAKDRTIICPRCRVVTDVPRMGGIYVLPVNLDLQEAIEGMRDFFDMGLALVPADPGRPPTPPPPRITPENEREYVTIGRIQNPPRMQVLVRVPVKNWYEVGLHLSLPEHELHSIEINNHRQKEICPREMFTFWLRYIPGASYEDLHMAMELVGEKPVLPLTPPKGPVTFATKSKSAKKRARLFSMKTRTGRPQMKDLVLVPIKDWYMLGLLLGMREYDLAVIAIDYNNDYNMCRKRMFSRWLASQPYASFEQLREALRWVDL